MKTPISYYGGKQQLASRILKLIPEHKIYCELFVGGGAIFFRKKPSKVEIINDINNELINFYEVVQKDFPALEKEVIISLHSRDLHRRASVIYQNPDMFDKNKRAWAVWVLANQFFGAILDGSFSYDKSGKSSKCIHNKRITFTHEYAIRLQNVQIECTDALRIIRSRDTKETFFYCDPPYVDADMGHYDGYTQEDFEMLINALEEIEGNFLLSSYRNNSLTEAIKRRGWCSIEIHMVKSMSLKSDGKRGKKIEVLTANYHIA